MFDFIPSCFRRHKKKLIFLGGVVGGVVFFNTYLKRKFIEWETQRSVEICDQLKKSNHFESTMITCDSLLTSFAQKIRGVIYAEVEVDAVVQELKGKPLNKIQLWEKLKVLVFTQVVGEMYATCVLCILLRVQMCILSGHSFANQSTKAKATDQQQKYMSHIGDFIQNGISKLLVQVNQVCTQVLKDYSLSEPQRLQDIEEIILDIQHSLSIDPLATLPDLTCLLMSPGNSKSTDKDNFLQNISAETKEVLECQDFKKVLHISIQCGISSIMDMMSGCFSRLSSKDEFTNINAFQIPLAKLIPEIHNAFISQDPAGDDALIRKLIQLEKLNNFAANIYEAFSQK